jgi:hypothetical protein
MSRVARVAVLACLIAAASAARAADDDPAAFVSELVTASKATAVSGLVVVARRTFPLSGVEVDDPVRCLPPRKPIDKTVPAPRLVNAYPANGQTVEPGYVVLRLTFDLPMACRGSVGADLLAACETGPSQIWHQTYDRRTLVILCYLKPDTRYEMQFNQNKIREHFQGLSGREPRAGGFRFKTFYAPPVMTVAGLVARDPQLAAVVRREAATQPVQAAAAE